jgi:hypothetical protein
MNTTSLAQCKQQWETAGWCVIEDVIPPDVLTAAQQALPSLFPTAEEFATNTDPERNRAFRGADAAPRPLFPFERGALDRVVLHDAMIDLAEALLDTRDLRLYQALANAKYSDATLDYDQLLHVDYGNHTLVVPRHDGGYQHLETFVYLSDVTPDTAATRFVSREHTLGIPVERTYLDLEEYADLYALEEPASGRAGSVLVYRPDVYHRGVPLRAKGAARFMLAVAFKPATTDWIGFHAFPVHAEDMAWHRFMRHATVRQLTLLGFPKPGDGYWTPATLAGVAARYPSLDMAPWRDTMSAG